MPSGPQPMLRTSRNWTIRVTAPVSMASRFRKPSAASQYATTFESGDHALLITFTLPAVASIPRETPVASSFRTNCVRPSGIRSIPRSQRLSGDGLQNHGRAEATPGSRKVENPDGNVRVIGCGVVPAGSARNAATRLATAAPSTRPPSSHTHGLRATRYPSRGRSAGAGSVDGPPDCGDVWPSNAKARSRVDWKRASGSFSRQRSTIRASDGDTSGRAAASDGGSSRVTAIITSIGVSPLKARRPLSIS